MHSGSGPKTTHGTVQCGVSYIPPFITFTSSLHHYTYTWIRSNEWNSYCSVIFSTAVVLHSTRGPPQGKHGRQITSKLNYEHQNRMSYCVNCQWQCGTVSKCYDGSTSWWYKNSLNIPKLKALTSQTTQ